MKRKEPTHSEELINVASSSSSSQQIGDYEGGTKRLKGNDSYEVFLSFKGEDTRKGFTDHLYNGLINAGIHVFRDDDKLPVGEEIGRELLYGITQSMISIPIISENYASSKWCLRELAHMLKCRRSRGQIVLPIFYKVPPSHLKTGLADAMNVFKGDVDEMVVKEWEEALKEVKSIKGLESEKIDNGHEGTLVKEIVRRVMGDLKRLFQLNVPKQLVGVNVENLVREINAKFNWTTIIGIYGMGGIGKTTLAKVLYNNLSNHFDHRSFLENIQETTQREGKKNVLKQLISNIMGTSCDVSNVDEGISIIKYRFTCKKVLVLLDDVGDDDTVLNAFVGDGCWFQAGSIIIITTRNKSILEKAKVDYMYPLKELRHDQSLILLSRHAFRRDYPPRDYEAISRDVASTTGGLPLALEVIGSSLYGRTEEVWKDTLKKLREVPEEKVQEKLKISYDILTDEDKNIFLDIACFFIGSWAENPTYMWDACGFYPRKGMDTLSLLSLIKIEYGGLKMHDQLRDLGREIVRSENKGEPQERSRLWNCEEALDVLDSYQGTRKIEALSLGRHGRGRTFTAEQFRGMTKLRFLQIDGADVTGDFQGLLPNLRWLQWQGCPLDFAAANFHLKKLVVLDLSDSEISEDWEGWILLKMATKLKVLDLHDCRNLRRTPDLYTLKSLEILDLSNWKRENDGYGIEEIHPSIGELTSLTELNLSRTRIRELPDAVGMLPKLQLLWASCCTNLERLPSNIGGLVSLEELSLVEVGHLPDELSEKLREIPELPSGLTDLHISFQGTSLPRLSHLNRLEKLILFRCPGLEYLPELPTGLLKLHIHFCDELKGSMNLSDGKQQVHEGHCPRESQLDGLLDLPNSKVPQKTDAASGMSSVDTQVSDICNCTSTGQLLDLSCLKCLRQLHIDRCDVITEIRFPNGSESLNEVEIHKCSSLRSLDVLNLKNLLNFYCINCENLVEIRGLEGLVHKPNLYIRGCPSLGQPLDPLS